MSQLTRPGLVSAVVAMIALAWLCSSARAENWPRFRGPTGQGISSEEGLPLRWAPQDNIAWATEIPGDGWSSPIVWDDHVFVTTTTDEGRSCHVICLDRRTGAILWNEQPFTQTLRHKRPDNSYATPTPVTDGERVVAVFGSGGIACYDMDGAFQWKNEEVEFFSQHGLGASPIIVNDLVIMPFDGSSTEGERIGFKIPWDGAVILGLDKSTGEVRWRGKRGLSRLAHVTPIVTQRDGEPIVISGAGDVIQAHAAKTGELQWTVYSQGEGVTPSIVLAEDLAVSCSGFEKPTIRAVRLGGEGDVTQSHVEWEQTRGVPPIASLLFVDPHLYSVTDRGVVTCFDSSSGEEVWRQRIGGKHVASPVYADGRIYFLSEAEGETVVIEPGPEYKELARNSVGELCKGSIAASQGNLFIRSEHRLFCIGPSPQ